jgi:hypothetical protein
MNKLIAAGLISFSVSCLFSLQSAEEKKSEYPKLRFGTEVWQPRVYGDIERARVSEYRRRYTDAIIKDSRASMSPYYASIEFSPFSKLRFTHLSYEGSVKADTDFAGAEKLKFRHFNVRYTIGVNFIPKVKTNFSAGIYNHAITYVKKDKAHGPYVGIGFETRQPYFNITPFIEGYYGQVSRGRSQEFDAGLRYDFKDNLEFKIGYKELKASDRHRLSLDGWYARCAVSF